ncbi:MAG: hypothetical protein ACRDNS_14080 [Trebonia sp.]
MGLKFIAIDPDTNGDHCPAVFADEETGDLLFQGATVADAATLAEVDGHSPIADSESVVRLPARMRAIILEALSGHATAIRRADSGDGTVGAAPGDAGRVHAV